MRWSRPCRRQHVLLSWYIYFEVITWYSISGGPAWSAIWREKFPYEVKFCWETEYWREFGHEADCSKYERFSVELEAKQETTERVNVVSYGYYADQWISVFSIIHLVASRSVQSYHSGNLKPSFSNRRIIACTTNVSTCFNAFFKSWIPISRQIKRSSNSHLLILLFFEQLASSIFLRYTHWPLNSTD